MRFNSLYRPHTPRAAADNLAIDHDWDTAFHEIDIWHGEVPQPRAAPEQRVNSRRFMSDVRIPGKSPAMGTHMARATLASRSCARWQVSSPKAAPSGTSSAGVGRNHALAQDNVGWLRKARRSWSGLLRKSHPASA